MTTESTILIGAEIVAIESELGRIAARREEAVSSGDLKAFTAAETSRADASSRLDFANARLIKAKHDASEAERQEKLARLSIHAEACGLEGYRAALREPLRKLVDGMKAALEAHDQMSALAKNAESELINASSLANELHVAPPVNVRPARRALAEIAVALSDALGARASFVSCLKGFDDDVMGTARSKLLDYVSTLLDTGTISGYDADEQLKCALEGTSFVPHSQRSRRAQEVAA